MKNLKTKNVLTFFSSLFVFVSVSVGQTTTSTDHKYAEFGIRFMPTITSLQIQSSDGNNVVGKATIGFGIGAFIGFNFNEHIGIQGEIIYSSISQNSTINELEQKINLKYVNIPLLFSLNSGKTNPINLNVVAGPQIGFNVGSSLTTTGNSDINNPDAILSVKKSDLGFAYGVGIDFGLLPAQTLRLSIGYRGVLGLLDISDTSNSTTTNSYYILDKSHIKTHSAYAGLSILF